MIFVYFSCDSLELTGTHRKPPEATGNQGPSCHVLHGDMILYLKLIEVSKIYIFLQLCVYLGTFDRNTVIFIIFYDI